MIQGQNDAVSPQILPRDRSGLVVECRTNN